jgi:dienelactone hydrolase
MRKAVIMIMALSLLTGAGAQAKLRTETVTYRQGDTTYTGYFAYDDAKSGKRPGVLVIHEWWGLTDYPKHRAEQLAELGYAAYAPDLFGKVATTPDEARQLAGQFYGDRTLLRERLNAALQTLAKRPEVDANKLAAIGYCFGGMGALELARSGADIKGVVSFHGGLSTPNPADAKNIKGHVLVEHGGADPNVKPEDLAAFMKEMNDGGVKWWHVDVYGDAVHGFTNPANVGDPKTGVAYNADADRRSWMAMQHFFDELFKP